MSLAQPLAAPAPVSAAEAGNARSYSVSELAFALKRTVEDAYGFVRLRGEISKVTRHASGHVYLTLKDERACIDGVVWKTVRGLKCRPEQGLEVIVTGRITTYPARSQYQLVIETMEPAGVGALLAQLERLKARLAAEGLFDAARKRPLPPMPAVIGVVTSPTGAVIRDILHRIADRWPVRVVVWPVVVQGEAAAAQVAAAVRGFNALDPDGAIPRPELIIVARGGGSVEDLWPFNDEALARAVSAGVIPLISAVGHETDTTLIDFVSDHRAPTPTAAAEIATPVLAELRAAVLGLAQRMTRCTEHGLQARRGRLATAAHGLPRPDDLLAFAAQRFDLVSGRLGAALERNAALHEHDLVSWSGRLNLALITRPQMEAAARLHGVAHRLDAAVARLSRDATRRAALPLLQTRMDAAVLRRLTGAVERVAGLEQLRRSLDPDRPLTRGFARVHRSDGGALVHAAAALSPGESVRLVFADGDRGARVDGEGAAARRPRRIAITAPTAQGDLF